MANCGAFAKHMIGIFKNTSDKANLLNARKLNTAICVLNYRYFHNFSSNVWKQKIGLPPVISSNALLISQPFYFQYSTSGKTNGQPNFELTFDDLQALIKSGDVQLFDVREPKELTEYGRYPCGVNIPLGEVKDALSLPEESFVERYKCPKPQLHHKNVVFCAQGPIKSKAAMELAQKLGYKKARHYKGGWEEYHEKIGLPFKQNPSS